MKVLVASRNTVRHRPTVLVTVLALLYLTVVVAVAQRRELSDFGRPRGPFRQLPNASYDGRFTFVRITYETGSGGYWYRGWPAWAHGYPLAEQNLMKIMNEVSYLDAHDDAINTLALDDPELCRYPVAYIIEASWWMMSDREGAALQSYLQKGGFVIVDDFKVAGDRGSPGWEPFESNMKRVLPEARFVDMEPSHPIFHSFFDIDNLDIIPQAYNVGRPIFRGLYEDNDVTKRLQMIVNFNTDISQFWEWSGTGLRSIDQTDEAYKLGVNYLVYGLTH